MSRNSIWPRTFILVLAAAVALPATAVAQGYVGRYVGARISRPSEQTGSAIFGRIGGLYTGYYDDAVGLPRQPGSGVSYSPQSGGAFGQRSRFSFSRLGGAPRLPAPLAGGRVGVGSRYSRPRISLFQTPRATESAIRGHSYLERAQSHWLPLGWEPPVPERLKTPIHLMHQEVSVFNKFFGLRATRSGPDVDPSSLAEGLRAQTEEYTHQRERSGQQAFTTAMQADGDERIRKLSRATALLSAARKLDPETYIPSLLMAHAALERTRKAQAAYYLHDVVRRHPEVFVEKPDIAAYFGDPKLLEQQMRRYQRVDEDESQLLDAYVIQAYCAWVRGDTVRIRTALATLDVISRGSPARERIVAFQRALEAGLR